MPETESFTATYKSDIDGHGLAGYWWFLSNGLDPERVPAHQEIVCDADAMTATYDVFTLDQAGRRIYLPRDADGQHAAVKHSVTVPIKYLPSIYGLPTAVAA